MAPGSAGASRTRCSFGYSHFDPQRLRIAGSYAPAAGDPCAAATERPRHRAGRARRLAAARRSCKPRRAAISTGRTTAAAAGGAAARRATPPFASFADDGVQFLDIDGNGTRRHAGRRRRRSAARATTRTPAAPALANFVAYPRQARGRPPSGTRPRAPRRPRRRRHHRRGSTAPHAAW